MRNADIGGGVRRPVGWQSRFLLRVIRLHEGSANFVSRKGGFLIGDNNRSTTSVSVAGGFGPAQSHDRDTPAGSIQSASPRRPVATDWLEPPGLL